MTVLVEDLGWWSVSEDGTVGAVRRAATALGVELGLPEDRVAALGIVATEVTTNLLKHAIDGAVHLRALRDDGAGRPSGVELVAIDAGPGMADLTASSRDGHSTAGTLGIGLGAIGRQATRLRVFSEPDRGTVLTAAVWADEAPAESWAAGLTRPIAGESTSGDAYAVRVADGRAQAFLADGLGHGPLASRASEAAAAAFREAPAASPAAVLEYVHRAVAHTRGAVAAVVDLDSAAGQLTCASVGNISGWIVGHDRRRGLAAQPGFVGDRQRRAIREYTYPVAGDDVVVLHTDGLTDRWDLAGHPGLLLRDPLTIAAALLREAGLRRDDAGVLVARPTASA
ncbi:ATP-binding protein [Luedemannella flava]|uniref:ATP-binding protein n=1 Tax=Luedemannella flava TaxID=349316 RepID=A0ABP4XXF9_9ACTN